MQRPMNAHRYAGLLTTLGMLTLTTAVTRSDESLARGRIHLQCGPLDTQQQTPAEIANALDAAAAGEAPHILVQFDRPVTPLERQELTRAGVRLLRYIGDNAYFAVVHAQRWYEIRRRPPLMAGSGAVAAPVFRSLRCVLPIAVQWKLHPDLLCGTPPPWSVVQKEPQATSSVDAASGPSAGEREKLLAVCVLFHPDVPLEPDAQRLCWRHGASIRSYLRSVNGLVIDLPLEELAALASADAVQWIEPPLPAFGPANNDVRLRTGAEVVQQAPYGLSGAGVRVMVYDTGYGFSAHPDFGGRHRTRDNSALSDHATHVAGTIGGDGAASNGTYRGMAPAVWLDAYGFQQVGGLQQGFLYTDPGDLERDYDDAINVQRADLANNSLSTNVATNGFPCHWEGNYGVTSALIDTIVRGDGNNPLFSRPFRVLWANGNERASSACLGVEGFPAPYHSTPPPACAKNLIAVGAVNSNDDTVTFFSSYGPADDGRLQPHIVAPGCQTTDDLGVTSCSWSGGYRVICGTSMSTPTVTGLAALLLEDYRRLYPGQADFRNSTLKAILAHTAADLGNAGPDYESGYGSVRIQPAVDLLRAGNFMEAQVDQNEVYSVVAVAPPGAVELKITLAWDDYPAAPNATVTLVNDLDLRVYDAGNNRYYPWTLAAYSPTAPAVRTEPNRTDNIEQVLIDNPAPGPYRVEVVGYNVPHGPQPFSLCATPVLARCSSAGTLALDRAKYMCRATVGLHVVDCDLNTDPQVSETVLVTVRSSSEPSGEPVLLTETDPSSAVFAGSVVLDTTNASGILLVAPGDTLTSVYIDADNGQGMQNVEVIATALVDCVPPVISNMQIDPIRPRDATIKLQTDEPARVTIRYGNTCGVPTNAVADKSYLTDHVFALAPLVEGSTYHFTIEARDEADNIVIDDNGGQCYTFVTPDIPRYFTELFEGDIDLQYRTFRFVPDGSGNYYAGCFYPISTLPTDPSAGTPVVLGDDQFVPVNLSGGASVSLYGANYNRIFIGSNGYITFTAGDTSFAGTLAKHFAMPRVSALFTDLNPSLGGTVTRQQLADRLVVTFKDVIALGGGTGNTFQIELFFDGQIALSYLEVGAPNAVSGLSAGNGVPPDFYETDLTALAACGPYPPTAYSAAVETPHHTPVDIVLNADDDGLPNPPGALTKIVTALPTHGRLFDPTGGQITADLLPYTLLNGGHSVRYVPNNYYGGPDSFRFKVNDGGLPPEGGDSNVATITLTVGERELIYSFPLDEDPGWRTEGLWAFGQPTGEGSSNGDPTTGRTGSYVYGYNLHGDYTNNMPRYHLTTTALDCTGVSRTELRFWRWLGVESSWFDKAGLLISSDGVQYYTVWEHYGTTASESAWTLQKYDISARADNQPTVFLRWAMGPTDASNTFPGWNIDDIEIWGVISRHLVGDLNCDLTVNFADINWFVLALAMPQTYAERLPDCPLANRDINGDGLFDFADINYFVKLLAMPPE